MGEIRAGRTAAEFSADTDNFDAFIGRGHTYVVALEQLIADVSRSRQVVSATIGHGVGPSDMSTRSCQELLAEASINNAYVAELSGSLKEPSVASVRLDGLGLAGPVLDGFVLDGVDRSAEEDLALMTRIRAQPLEQAGVPSKTVARLVAGAEGHRAAVALLAAGVHPNALVDPSVERVADVGALLAGDDRANVQTEHLEALLGRDYRPALEVAIMSGETAPPDNATRDLVVDAMVAGLAPEDVGLAGVYFPSFYLRDVGLRKRISETQDRREVIDGSSWLWFDHDPEELAAVDAELDHLRTLRDEFAAEQGIADDGSLGYLDAVVATSDTNAGSAWEGLAYGFQFRGFHETKVSRSGALKNPDGQSVELRHIGERLATDPTAAAVFFNHISVDGTADLATFLAANDLGRDVFDTYGHALAGASRVTSPDGQSQLMFSGEDLLGRKKPRTADGVIWHSPALLFAAGQFDPAYLAGATGAVLQLAEQGDRQGQHTILGTQLVPGPEMPTVIMHQGGEDPRNILLARTAEQPEAAELLIESLTRDFDGSSGSTSAQTVGALDPLLRPRVPFAPTAEHLPPEHWIDRLQFGLVVAEPDPAAGPGAGVAFPEVASHYPITSFLGTVAADDALSRTVLRYVGDGVSAHGPMIKDPGTASGLDLILAKHATFLVATTELRAAGIAPTTLNYESEEPVTTAQWKTVYQEVLRLGRGQALAAKTYQLLRRAFHTAVGTAGFVKTTIAVPFAKLAGETAGDVTRALVTYSRGLDDLARERNRRASLAAGLTFAALGLVPYLGLASTAASAGWTWFFDGYPTDNELEFRTKQAERSEWAIYELWEDRAAEEFYRSQAGPNGPGTIDVMLPVLGKTTVPLEMRQMSRGSVTYRWQHPLTKTWRRVPMPSVGEFSDLFGSTSIDSTTSTWLAVMETRDLMEEYVRLHGPASPIEEELGLLPD